MTEEIEQAHHEMDRLQEIISRHEGHIFALRGWLLTVEGALLAAYYTDNIEMSDSFMRLGLPLIALLFLFVESRHINLVEAVVERSTGLEMCIERSRDAILRGDRGWYDGPKVSEACQAGARRWWPRRGMTLVLNLPFYLVVILVTLFATFSLPSKQRDERATFQSLNAHASPPL